MNIMGMQWAVLRAPLLPRGATSAQERSVRFKGRAQANASAHQVLGTDLRYGAGARVQGREQRSLDRPKRYRLISDVGDVGGTFDIGRSRRCSHGVSMYAMCPRP